jgi:hypothetical protein
MMSLVQCESDYVTQVEKVIESSKLVEVDVFHYLVDIDPDFLALGPFFLDFSMRFPSHFFPILGRFLYAIKAALF